MLRGRDAGKVRGRGRWPSAMLPSFSMKLKELRSTIAFLHQHLLRLEVVRVKWVLSSILLTVVEMFNIDSRVFAARWLRRSFLLFAATSH